MTSARTHHPDRGRLLGVMAYYLVMGLAVAALVRWVPAVGESVSGAALTELSEANPFGDNTASVGTPVAQTPWAGGLLGVISMVGALAIMIPVTRIYMITRRHRGYDESVVHTLLILPVAVTGIVMIVQHSLALAFSLAGIVAAVRFRTTLDDTKDAVYVFLAIGVGLASGVQAMGLALVLSLVFNAVVLVLWATRFGNPYAASSAGTGHMTLGDALAGQESAATRRVVGDVSMLDAADPKAIGEALAQAARLERHLAEERLQKKSKRANGLLLVHTTQVAAAQGAVEPLLDDRATRWRLAEVVETSTGGAVLEYLVRVDDPEVAGGILDGLRQESGPVGAVEFRSLDGLKAKG